jgi:hypothetical protein
VLWKEIQSLQVEERYDYDALTQHQIRKVPVIPGGYKEMSSIVN